MVKTIATYDDYLNLKKEAKQMASIKETASSYEAPTTKNIADLQTVDANLELQDREGKDSHGEVFKYKVIVVEDVEYRVPSSVLGNLKAILKENPNLAKFKVTKIGEGMNTKYTVIPLS